MRELGFTQGWSPVSEPLAAPDTFASVCRGGRLHGEGLAQAPCSAFPGTWHLDGGSGGGALGGTQDREAGDDPGSIESSYCYF